MLAAQFPHQGLREHDSRMRSLFSQWLFRGSFVYLAALATVLFGQAPAPGAPPGMTTQPAANAGAGASQTAQAPQQGEQNFQGSVAEGTASQTPLALTLGDAINR